MVIQMIETPKPPIRLPDDDVKLLMEAENERINRMIRAMPKVPMSFRLQVIHQMAVAAICTETGLTTSEVLERLVMTATAQALRDKELPAVEDYPAVPFQISGKGEAA